MALLAHLFTRCPVRIRFSATILLPGFARACTLAFWILIMAKRTTKKTKYQQALQIVRAELRKNGDIRHGWQANIAMAFFDESRRSSKRGLPRVELHRVANEAADHFINKLLGV